MSRLSRGREKLQQEVRWLLQRTSVFERDGRAVVAPTRSDLKIAVRAVAKRRVFVCLQAHQATVCGSVSSIFSE